MRKLYPLWMLKYLPNMPACHIAITHDARGPQQFARHGRGLELVGGRRGGEHHRAWAGRRDGRRRDKFAHPSDDLRAGGTRDTAREAKDPRTAIRPFDAGRCGAGIRRRRRGDRLGKSSARRGPRGADPGARAGLRQRLRAAHERLAARGHGDQGRRSATASRSASSSRAT